MYHGINSSDKVGSLITQLRVIQDDLEFLQRVKQPMSLEDYPFLAKTANTTLLNAQGDLCTTTANRLENAGFWVWKSDNKIHFHTQHGAIVVPIHFRTRVSSNSDWRDALVG